MKILKPCDTKEAEKYLNTKVLYADDEDDFCEENIGILRHIDTKVYKDTPYYIVYENHDQIYHKMIKVE